MKCEICHENEASVVLKQVVDGSVREVTICPVCAAANSLGLALGSHPCHRHDEERPAAEPGASAVCAACGMSVADLHRRSRLGCEHCYAAFEAQLVALMSDLQPSTHHAGRVPAADKVVVERHALEARLGKAVAIQDFETAARIRDRITALKARATGESDGSR